MSFTFLPVRPDVLLSDDDFQRIIGCFVQSLEETGAQLGTEDDLTRPGTLFFLVVY